MGGRAPLYREDLLGRSADGWWTRDPRGGPVVIGTLSPETMARLTKAAPGPVTKVSEAPPTLVIGGKAEDARRLCQRINQVVGAEGVVAPFLCRRGRKPPVPDRASPGPSRGRAVGRHALGLRRAPSGRAVGRNKREPRQADFLVRRDDERFLPDIASAMAKGEGVVEAWPVIRAAFRRLPS